MSLKRVPTNISKVIVVYRCHDEMQSICIILHVLQKNSGYLQKLIVVLYKKAVLRGGPLMIWGGARAKARKKTQRLLAQEKKTQLNNPEEKKNSTQQPGRKKFNG